MIILGTLILVLFSLLGIVDTVTKKINLINFFGFEVNKKVLKMNMLLVVSIFFLFFLFLFLFLFLLINIQFDHISINQINRFIISVIFSDFIQAFIEELLLRGLVFLFIYSKSRSIPFAVIVSSLLFTILHSTDNIIIGGISYFLAGSMYCLIMLKFKSIWMAVVLHFSWNYFQGYLFGFPVGGEVENSLLILDIKSSTLFNGGDAGPEESVLGICLRALIIGMIFLIPKRWTIQNNLFLKLQ